MAIIVQKFGGTSVADTDHIKNVARRVKSEVQAGNQVAVVVSAMAGVTNQLVEWVKKTSPFFDPAEYDVVVSSGEQVTSGLLAIALQDIGVPAKSWLSWQVPIISDHFHSKARIKEIQVQNLKESMMQGVVAIVPGFQAITEMGRISTLGRGGSDTSAVALAAALEALRCDIYTDVDGVYTCDPRIVTKARKITKITYEEMLELASQGTKVLHTRSVEMAMKLGVRLRVLSSFEDVPGTLVVDESEIMEQELVSGIAYDYNEAKISLIGIPCHPESAARVFGSLAGQEINVDMIVQNVTRDGKDMDITFTVGLNEADHTLRILNKNQASIGFSDILIDKNVVKISVVGVGMKSHSGVAQRMFETLGQKGIDIQVITTSEIKIGVLIAREYAELALRALHSAYGLDQE